MINNRFNYKTTFIIFTIAWFIISCRSNKPISSIKGLDSARTNIINKFHKKYAKSGKAYFVSIYKTDSLCYIFDIDLDKAWLPDDMTIKDTLGVGKYDYFPNQYIEIDKVLYFWNDKKKGATSTDMLNKMRRYKALDYSSFFESTARDFYNRKKLYKATHMYIVCKNDIRKFKHYHPSRYLLVKNKKRYKRICKRICK